MLYDNAFNLDNYIITEFGKALANAEEDAFLNGDGTGKPLGLFAATGGGDVAATLTAAIKSDDLLDLVYALKRPYRKTASFILNDQILATVRKLKDNNGAYMALSQMKAKGRAQGEEMLQLAERGVNAYQYLADYLGTDIPGVMRFAFP